MMDPLLLSHVVSKVFDSGQEGSEGIFQRLRKTPGTTPPAPTLNEVPPKHLPEVERPRA